MPSAASKLEKQASSGQQQAEPSSAAAAAAAAAAVVASATAVDSINAAAYASNTPIKQAIIIIEHKIRNLEKRKTKLESYRAIKLSGKELSADQKAAVEKYDEVAQSLEFARDLTKQMGQLSVAAEKEQKKQARKDGIIRAQQETSKIREVLMIQNMLSHFEEERVRDDFLNGTNGAVKLSDSDLSTLEQFYIDITVRRQDTPEQNEFVASAQKAAEHLSLTIDGRPKQYGETTFEAIREIFQQIQESGYFDKYFVQTENTEEAPQELEPAAEVDENNAEEEVVVVEETIVLEENNIPAMVETVEENPVEAQQPQHVLQQQPQHPQQHPPQHQHQTQTTGFPSEAPSAGAVPPPVFRQQQHPVQILTAQGMPIIPAQTQQMQRQIVVSPITVQGQVVPQQPPQHIQQQQQQPPQQVVGAPGIPQQQPNPLHSGHFPPTTVRAVEQGYFNHQFMQMRPLAEVIGGGANFFFLQDSEIDAPEVDEQQQHIPQQQQPAQPTQQIPIQQQQQQQPLKPPPQLQQQQQPPSGGVPSAIPTQTFTNQAFPPIVPQQATSMYPPRPNVVVPDQQQQPQPTMSVFPQPPPAAIIPMPLLAAQPLMDGQQQMVNVMQPNLITGPNASSVPLPGFPNAVVTPSSSNNDVVVIGKFQNVPNNNNNTSHTSSIDNQNEEQPNSNEWENHHRSVRDSSVGGTQTESNQWSNEMNAVTTTNAKNINANATSSNNSSNEWNNSFENSQPPAASAGGGHDSSSNHWNSNNSHQNDGYSRSRNNFGRNDRNREGGRVGGGGGDRDNRGGMRSGGGGGPPSSVGGERGGGGGGYRGSRSNNYPSSQQGGGGGQQNGRSNVYFRNNDNSYYQNGSGGGGGGTGGSGGSYNNSKENNNSRYDNSSNGNNYRSRGGVSGGSRGANITSGGGGGGANAPASTQQQQPRNNVNSSSSNRSGGMGGGMGGGGPRSGGGGAGGRGPSFNRPPRQQDINA